MADPKTQASLVLQLLQRRGFGSEDPAVRSLLNDALDTAGWIKETRGNELEEAAREAGIQPRTAAWDQYVNNYTPSELFAQGKTTFELGQQYGLQQDKLKTFAGAAGAEIVGAIPKAALNIYDLISGDTQAQAFQLSVDELFGVSNTVDKFPLSQGAAAFGKFIGMLPSFAVASRLIGTTVGATNAMRTLGTKSPSLARFLMSGFEGGAQELFTDHPSWEGAAAFAGLDWAVRNRRFANALSETLNTKRARTLGMITKYYDTKEMRWFREAEIAALNGQNPLPEDYISRLVKTLSLSTSMSEEDVAKTLARPAFIEMWSNALEASVVTVNKSKAAHSTIITLSSGKSITLDSRSSMLELFDRLAVGDETIASVVGPQGMIDALNRMMTVQTPEEIRTLFRVGGVRTADAAELEKLGPEGLALVFKDNKFGREFRVTADQLGRRSKEAQGTLREGVYSGRLSVVSVIGASPDPKINEQQLDSVLSQLYGKRYSTEIPGVFVDQSAIPSIVVRFRAPRLSGEKGYVNMEVEIPRVQELDGHGQPTGRVLGFEGDVWSGGSISSSGQRQLMRGTDVLHNMKKVGAEVAEIRYPNLADIQTRRNIASQLQRAGLSPSLDRSEGRNFFKTTIQEIKPRELSEVELGDVVDEGGLKSLQSAVELHPEPTTGISIPRLNPVVQSLITSNPRAVRWASLKLGSDAKFVGANAETGVIVFSKPNGARVVIATKGENTVSYLSHPEFPHAFRQSSGDWAKVDEAVSVVTFGPIRVAKPEEVSDELLTSLRADTLSKGWAIYSSADELRRFGGVGFDDTGSPVLLDLHSLYKYVPAKPDAPFDINKAAHRTALNRYLQARDAGMDHNMALIVLGTDSPFRNNPELKTALRADYKAGRGFWDESSETRKFFMRFTNDPRSGVGHNNQWMLRFLSPDANDPMVRFFDEAWTKAQDMVRAKKVSSNAHGFYQVLRAEGVDPKLLKDGFGKFFKALNKPEDPRSPMRYFGVWRQEGKDLWEVLSNVGVSVGRSKEKMDELLMQMRAFGAAGSEEDRTFVMEVVLPRMKQLLGRTRAGEDMFYYAQIREQRAQYFALFDELVRTGDLTLDDWVVYNELFSNLPREMVEDVGLNVEYLRTGRNSPLVFNAPHDTPSLVNAIRSNKFISSMVRFRNLRADSMMRGADPNAWHSISHMTVEPSGKIKIFYYDAAEEIPGKKQGLKSGLVEPDEVDIAGWGPSAYGALIQNGTQSARRRLLIANYSGMRGMGHELGHLAATMMPDAARRSVANHIANLIATQIARALKSGVKIDFGDTKISAQILEMARAIEAGKWTGGASVYEYQGGANELIAYFIGRRLLDVTGYSRVTRTVAEAQGRSMRKGVRFDKKGRMHETLDVRYGTRPLGTDDTAAVESVTFGPVPGASERVTEFHTGREETWEAVVAKDPDAINPEDALAHIDEAEYERMLDDVEIVDYDLPRPVAMSYKMPPKALRYNLYEQALREGVATREGTTTLALTKAGLRRATTRKPFGKPGELFQIKGADGWYRIVSVQKPDLKTPAGREAWEQLEGWSLDYIDRNKRLREQVYNNPQTVFEFAGKTLDEAKKLDEKASITEIEDLVPSKMRKDKDVQGALQKTFEKRRKEIEDDPTLSPEQKAERIKALGKKEAFKAVAEKKAAPAPVKKSLQERYETIRKTIESDPTLSPEQKAELLKKLRVQLGIAPKETTKGPERTVKAAAYITDEMRRRGLDPNRPFNDVDVTNKSVRDAILMDPTLSPEQKAQILKTGSPNPPPEPPVQTGLALPNPRRFEAPPEKLSVIPREKGELPSSDQFESTLGPQLEAAEAQAAGRQLPTTSIYDKDAIIVAENRIAARWKYSRKINPLDVSYATPEQRQAVDTLHSFLKAYNDALYETATPEEKTFFATLDGILDDAFDTRGMPKDLRSKRTAALLNQSDYREAVEDTYTKVLTNVWGLSKGVVDNFAEHVAAARFAHLVETRLSKWEGSRVTKLATSKDLRKKDPGLIYAIHKKPPTSIKYTFNTFDDAKPFIDDLRSMLPPSNDVWWRSPTVKETYKIYRMSDEGNFMGMSGIVVRKGDKGQVSVYLTDTYLRMTHLAQRKLPNVSIDDAALPPLKTSTPAIAREVLQDVSTPASFKAGVATVTTGARTPKDMYTSKLEKATWGTTILEETDPSDVRPTIKVSTDTHGNPTVDIPPVIERRLKQAGMKPADIVQGFHGATTDTESFGRLIRKVHAIRQHRRGVISRKVGNTIVHQPEVVLFRMEAPTYVDKTGQVKEAFWYLDDGVHSARIRANYTDSSIDLDYFFKWSKGQLSTADVSSTHDISWLLEHKGGDAPLIVVADKDAPKFQWYLAGGEKLDETRDLIIQTDAVFAGLDGKPVDGLKGVLPKQVIDLLDLGYEVRAVTGPFAKGRAGDALVAHLQRQVNKLPEEFTSSISPGHLVSIREIAHTRGYTMRLSPDGIEFVRPAVSTLTANGVEAAEQTIKVARTASDLRAILGDPGIDTILNDEKLTGLAPIVRRMASAAQEAKPMVDPANPDADAVATKAMSWMKKGDAALSNLSTKPGFFMAPVGKLAGLLQEKTGRPVWNLYQAMHRAWNSYESRRLKYIAEQVSPLVKDLDETEQRIITWHLDAGAHRADLPEAQKVTLAKFEATHKELLTDKIVERGKKIREWFDSRYEEFGVSRSEDEVPVELAYVPWRRSEYAASYSERAARMGTRALDDNIDPMIGTPWFEHARLGDRFDAMYDDRIGGLMVRYADTAVRMQELRPISRQIRGEIDFIRQAANASGGFDNPNDLYALETLRHINNMVTGNHGPVAANFYGGMYKFLSKIVGSDVANVVTGNLTSWGIHVGLGFRPGSAIRNVMYAPVPVYSLLGGKHLRTGMSVMIDKMKGGGDPEFLKYVDIEQDTFFSGYYTEVLEMMKAGKLQSRGAIKDLPEKYLKAALKMQEVTERFNRGFSFFAGVSSAKEITAKYGGRILTEDMQRQLVHESPLGVFSRAEQDYLIEALQRNPDEFIQKYADSVVRFTQFSYGPFESFRAANNKLGKLAFFFGTWTVNQAAMIAALTRRMWTADGRLVQISPQSLKYMARYSIGILAGWEAMKLAGLNPTSTYSWGPAGYAGSPYLQLIRDLGMWATTFGHEKEQFRSKALYGIGKVFTPSGAFVSDVVKGYDDVRDGEIWNATGHVLFGTTPLDESKAAKEGRAVHMYPSLGRRVLETDEQAAKRNKSADATRRWLERQ